MNRYTKLVVIESPLRGQVPAWCPTWLAPFAERILRARNMHYAKLCVRDSLARGEAPYASHVFFDRQGLLDDAKPEERRAGFQAGISWGAQGTLRAVYCDHGSDGMRSGISSSPPGQAIEYRWLYDRRDPMTTRYIAQLEGQMRFRQGSA